MCDKRASVNVCIQNKFVRVDECLRETIWALNRSGVITVASCCGHGHYHPTILVRNKKGEIYDIFSGIKIPRVRNFYKTDDYGFYYIPEVERWHLS